MGVSAEEINLVPIVFFIPVKGVDLRHLLVGQYKVIQLSVFLDVIRIAGAGDDRHTLLQIPPEDHLSGGRSMGLRNSGDYSIAQQVCRMALAPKGIPSLHYNAQVLDIGDHIVLLIVGVNFILHQRRDNGHLGQKFLQLLDIPVGQPDRADFAV